MWENHLEGNCEDLQDDTWLKASGGQQKALPLTPLVLAISFAWAAPVPGGTLNPFTIPKCASPLVIPPVMTQAETPSGAGRLRHLDAAVQAANSASYSKDLESGALLPVAKQGLATSSRSPAAGKAYRLPNWQPARCQYVI